MIRAIVQVIAAILVGGSIGYVVTRAFGVRLGRVEVLLVFLGIAAYWLSGMRDERRRVTA